MQKKFQYKCIQLESKGVLGGHINAADFQAELNKHGAKGWELVSVIDNQQSNGRSRETLVTFKKLIQ